MKHGKKATAQRLFNEMLEKVKESEMKRVAGNSKGTAEDGTIAHMRASRVDPSESSTFHIPAHAGRTLIYFSPRSGDLLGSNGQLKTIGWSCWCEEGWRHLSSESRSLSKTPHPPANLCHYAKFPLPRSQSRYPRRHGLSLP